jgi:hypothetical protein
MQLTLLFMMLFFEVVGNGRFSKDISSMVTLIDTLRAGECLEYEDIINHAFQSTMIEHSQKGDGYVFRISEEAAEALFRSNECARRYDIQEIKDLSNKVLVYINYND